MNIIEAIETNNIEYVINNKGKFNPNQRGQYDFYLLHRAAYLGNYEIVQLLLDYGADIDIFDEDRFTPLHSIIDGNENNWFDTIELLIKNGANVNTYRVWRDFDETKSKESILITAVCSGLDAAVVELLLKNNADVNFIDSSGDKAINYAHDLGYMDIVKLLNKYGAEYDGKITKDEQIMIDYAIGMEESYKIRNKLKKREDNGYIKSSN